MAILHDFLFRALKSVFISRLIRFLSLRKILNVLFHAAQLPKIIMNYQMQIILKFEEKRKFESGRFDHISL